MKEAELIAIRRQLHQIPELALQEKETHAFLLKTILHEDGFCHRQVWQLWADFL